MTAGMLGQLSLALQELIESGAWSNEDELKVCVAGTLPKDKFIVIQNITKRGEEKTNGQNFY
ncbi:MAG: hypothetical protein EB127_30515 [Alphaproteobacteria bacterium]|nr:hypothetical protein [Alphaproteobacteria bacterium]